ncbi:alpha/beta hydrolase [Allokutzneria oryzae]|uniref:Alpha/beta hydrolase n=1 Tax=Allokutzneria oryzae TaxID=1378989 RepID=A0ABV5ZNA6_9PSEU
MTRKWLAFAATALTLLSAVTAAEAEPAPPRLEWTACGKGAQCATLRVPVDWRKQKGPATTIDVVRIPARDPKHRIGTVIANLGSGNSTFAAIDPPPYIEPTLRHLSERLDVVVFDPRGLGRTPGSTKFDCGDNPGPYNGLILAEDEAGWRKQAELNAKYAATCREQLGELFNGLNTWQATNDVEALRVALGEKRLRFFGNSYGTVYGQTYAQLFPDRVERMYLDGVADHTQARLEDWLRNYAVAQERQFEHFRDWCAQRKGCFLHGQDAVAVWDELVARAGRAPLPAPSAGAGRTVDLRHLFAGALVGSTPPKFPVLAKAMAMARDGDAGMFLTDLTYGELNASPGKNVLSMTQCNDFFPKPPGYQELLAIEKRLKQVAPRFGWIEGRFEVGRCAGISGGAAFPPQPLKIDKLAPVLVGIGELDQNTNTIGAAHVAGQLPSSQTLWHGDGHAAYLLGNTCLREHVGHYLTDGVLPPRGTRCAAELTTKIPDRP